MVIQKRVEIIPVTTDGKDIRVGDTLVFRTKDGRCCVGKYMGISERGAVMFNDPIAEDSFNILPKSILQIFKANLDIQTERELHTYVS